MTAAEKHENKLYQRERRDRKAAEESLARARVSVEELKAELAETRERLALKSRMLDTVLNDAGISEQKLEESIKARDALKDFTSLLSILNRV